MDVEAATALVNQEVYRLTKKYLSDLQQAIVTQVWQGKKYWEIADEYGCTEGHIKDTGSLLWKLLSTAWGIKVTKNNFRSMSKLKLQSLNRHEIDVTSSTWLHPIVQAEARSRLQRSHLEWQQAHRQIAIFLSDSVDKINSIQAGLTALEAYYYHAAVRDYPAAARVILQSLENQWGQFLTLGTTLNRLGIIQPLLTAINQIIERIEHDRHRSELNNILGDLYWTTGRVHQAISCQQETIVTSQNCLKLIPLSPENKYDLYYWRMLEVDSLLSLGLYNIDLWELTTAADLFQQVVNLAHNTKHLSWSEKAALGLALVNSYLFTSERPETIVTRLYRLIVDLEDRTYNTGRFAYFMQILGQIFFNHQQIKPAKVMWQRAITFARESHYTQYRSQINNWFG